MEIGMKYTQTKMVTDAVTAASFGEGLMPVLATPYLIAFLEETAANCVEGELPDTQITLGTMVNVKHLSAAPVGEEVTCEAVLTGIDRRRLMFDVRCWDDAGLISEGTHERFIADIEPFLQRTYAKLEREQGTGNRD